LEKVKNVRQTSKFVLSDHSLHHFSSSLFQVFQFDQFLIDLGIKSNSDDSRHLGLQAQPDGHVRSDHGQREKFVRKIEIHSGTD